MNAEPLEPTEAFLAAAKEYGLVFDAGDLSRLGRYLSMLLEANTRFNLTAITDPNDAWRKHIFDSLTLLPLLASVEAGRIIDVGSGGGLPGVPLAITMPHMKFTLLEATRKKADFLREVTDALDLTNVDIVNDRAETIGHDRERHREQYDVVLARAVGRMPVLLELAAPLAKIEGHILAIKGERVSEELTRAKQALHLLHCQLLGTVRTPTGTIVIVQKLRRTPKLYPRRPGEPRRVPLGLGKGRAQKK